MKTLTLEILAAIPLAPQAQADAAGVSMVGGAEMTLSMPPNDNPFIQHTTGTKIPVKTFPFLIGRSDANHLVVKKGEVSGKHGSFIKVADGFAFADNSTNGSSVNDLTVHNIIRELVDGDVICISAVVPGLRVRVRISQDGTLEEPLENATTVE